MATTLTYGAYSFSPVPLIDISKELQQTIDGTILGEQFNITLNGTLTIPSSQGSIITIRSMQDALMSGLAQNGQHLELKCDSTVLLSAYPLVRGVTFPNGIWVNTSPYTVEMEFFEQIPGSGSTNFVSDASEEWQVEFDDNAKWNWTLPGGTGDANAYRLRLAHNVSATGKPKYNSSGLSKAAWENARDYVITKLGIDTTYITNSGVFNLNGALFSAYDHIRTIAVNEAGGTYGVNETWLVQQTGVNGAPYNGLEDFTISLRKGIDSPFTSVSIDGNIQGVETRSYGTNPGDFSISETKYISASGTWNIVKDRLLGRANLLLDTISTLRDINPTPLSTVVGHNPNTGNISYAYEYNDRPTTCIANAISESITINDSNPTDAFARLFILGRSNGPILQDLSTKTESVRELSIEAVIQPPTGCPTSGNVSYYFAQRPDAAINTIVNGIEADLEATYSSVFKSVNQINWIPTEGRISVNVAWTYGSCS